MTESTTSRLLGLMCASGRPLDSYPTLARFHALGITDAMLNGTCRAPQGVLDAALKQAYRTKQVDLYRALILLGADIRGFLYTPYLYAAQGSVAGLVPHLDPSRINTPDSLLGLTSLQWAAYYGQTAIANLLLQHGARADLGSPTPLALAAHSNHKDCFRSLLRWHKQCKAVPIQPSDLTYPFDTSSFESPVRSQRISATSPASTTPEERPGQDNSAQRRLFLGHG